STQVKDTLDENPEIAGKALVPRTADRDENYLLNPLTVNRNNVRQAE
ncbi:9509_t:CDS:1, partial [Racocetra persica]